MFVNTENLSNESNLLKLKAKLRLLNVIIKEVMKAINNIEKGANDAN